MRNKSNGTGTVPSLTPLPPASKGLTVRVRYHWAFLIGPKKEKSAREVPGVRCHVKNVPKPTPHGRAVVWTYEELKLCNVRTTSNLLIRVVIGKVVDMERLLDTIRNVPLVQNDRMWRCCTWCADVLAALERDGQALGTAVLDWKRIQKVARHYAGEKTAQGRFDAGHSMDKPKPTWDMLKDKETVA
ncbi:hypothetical protein AYO21_07502 [Fonsecaea monophora]|uniref:Uncharacterized protein n=1 Tax=Fonsecaea monophora TaxID=254056 RepID=A0A177F372_9EURO|nr:hypothetical protein AYO21_07502 [Fonsecaea monophora]OAG38276.1 hypothetical protein AYO21_07502 [Fonsecaea monophora]